MTRSQDRLFMVGRRSIVVSYDAETLERETEFPTAALKGTDTSLFVVHPDGSLFLSVTDRLRVMDTTTKKEIAITAFPKAAMGKPLTQFAYAADGKTGVARWGDAVTAVWHPKLSGTPRTLEDAKTPTPASPNALAISPDGRVGILGAGDGRLKAWDTSNGTVLFDEDVFPPANTGHAIAAIAVLPDGRRFLTAGSNGVIILWELDGFKRVKEYRGPSGPWRLDISSDGRVAILVQAGLIQRIDLPAVSK
jgi:WD40 repeat protein